MDVSIKSNNGSAPLAPPDHKAIKFKLCSNKSTCQPFSSSRAAQKKLFKNSRLVKKSERALLLPGRIKTGCILNKGCILTRPEGGISQIAVDWFLPWQHGGQEFPLSQPGTVLYAKRHKWEVHFNYLIIGGRKENKEALCDSLYNCIIIKKVLQLNIWKLINFTPVFLWNCCFIRSKINFHTQLPKSRVVRLQNSEHLFIYLSSRFRLFTKSCRKTVCPADSFDSIKTSSIIHFQAAMLTHVDIS